MRLPRAKGDVEILSFALTLELLDADFSTKPQTLKRDADAMKMAKEIGRDSTRRSPACHDHAARRDADGQADLLVSLGKPADFGKPAQTLEDTGASAYNGAAPAITSKDVLGAADSIVQIEARHATAIRLYNNETPAPPCL